MQLVLKKSLPIIAFLLTIIICLSVTACKWAQRSSNVLSQWDGIFEMTDGLDDALTAFILYDDGTISGSGEGPLLNFSFSFTGTYTLSSPFSFSATGTATGDNGIDTIEITVLPGDGDLGSTTGSGTYSMTFGLGSYVDQLSQNWSVAGGEL